MNTRAFLSPRRWRRLGWQALPLLVEVARSYYVYQKMEANPLPESLERLSKAGKKKRTNPGEIVRVTDWFLHPIHGASRCMPRSAILFRMLSRRGFDPIVVFGVSKEETDLDGHAWVLLDGEPLREWDDPTAKYVETYRYPASSKQQAASRDQQAASRKQE